MSNLPLQGYGQSPSQSQDNSSSAGTPRIGFRLGSPVTTMTFTWRDLVQRSWGSEFFAPDHGAYEFSGGRKFDSTDTGNTGIYNGGATT